jgi:cytochrome c
MARLSRKGYAMPVLVQKIEVGGSTMTLRSPTLLSVASPIAALACEPIAAAQWATKEEAVAMVKKAVALIEEQGPYTAYAEITNKTGRFHDRDLYITVLGLDGKVLAHGANESLIGKVLIDATDADGKQFVKERSELARQQPSFWQNYKFMNPVSKKIEPKQMYCERLNETAVCGGVYSF